MWEQGGLGAGREGAEGPGREGAGQGGLTQEIHKGEDKRRARGLARPGPGRGERHGGMERQMGGARCPASGGDELEESRVRLERPPRWPRGDHAHPRPLRSC